METTRIKEYRFGAPAGGLLWSVVNEVLLDLDSNISTRSLGIVAKNFNSYWDIFGGCPKIG
jgi:hypothetical protein